MEVSQHAYDYLCIRAIVLFVFLRNNVIWYLYIFLLNKLCLSLPESETEQFVWNSRAADLWRDDAYVTSSGEIGRINL